jgi:hypothetical protein
MYRFYSHVTDELTEFLVICLYRNWLHYEILTDDARQHCFHILLRYGLA